MYSIVYNKNINAEDLNERANIVKAVKRLWMLYKNTKI